MTSIILSRKMPENAADLVMVYLRPQPTVFSDPSRIVIKDVAMEHVRTKNGKARFRVGSVDLLSDPRVWRFYVEADTPFQYGNDCCHLDVATMSSHIFRKRCHYECTLLMSRCQDRTEDVAPQYRCTILRKEYVGRR